MPGQPATGELERCASVAGVWLHRMTDDVGLEGALTMLAAESWSPGAEVA